MKEAGSHSSLGFHGASCETQDFNRLFLVLEDEFAQYCLLEFSASGSLLLSTRSSAQIDVFDHQGGFCYDIPLVRGQLLPLKLQI